ncbi:MAG TPA: hypothetical protein VG604_01035 [Candidatus Saccharimonadales bacterium]|nr:hypothetical protein [Candidatus Saccharimonadales bacterium]
MKRFRSIILAAACSLMLVAPVGLAAPAFANPTNVVCLPPETPQDPEPQFTTVGCDLALVTQVSVNDGDFVTATSSSSPVKAAVGDTITIRLSASNDSLNDLTAFGFVTVTNVLPGNLSLVSSSATGGTYSNGNWVFTAEDDLPASLTLITKATAAGSVADTATYTDYLPDNCDGPCEDPPYFDANAANNSSAGFILINGVLVRTSSLPGAPNTGFGVFQLNTTQRLITYVALASGLAGLAFVIRRSARRAN